MIHTPNPSQTRAALNYMCSRCLINIVVLYSIVGCFYCSKPCICILYVRRAI